MPTDATNFLTLRRVKPEAQSSNIAMGCYVAVESVLAFCKDAEGALHYRRSGTVRQMPGRTCLELEPKLELGLGA